ncbi:MAG TPA: glycosyltransferase family 4 protein [Desulfuromonadaceae bacterium]|nr:glycosyltransferase family 4 protein [Desulfuromonadaceae bacterium]
MKVLLDHPLPFSLAHGGVEIQIEQTKAALENAGVEVEYLRWWDVNQRGDIIHFVGRPAPDYIALAQGRGFNVVMAELLTATGSRSSRQLAFQKLFIRLSRKLLPQTFTSRLAWDSYRLADACIALTSWEAQLMRDLFNAPGDRVHVVPNGVEEVFLGGPRGVRGDWLVCTATITERKRVLELAQAAVEAQVPVWIVGRAYSESDPYAKRFFELAKQHPRLIRYEGAIADRSKLAAVYREARGFVLLSNMESLSLSALEAAACGCPLLLSDLPWARGTFNGHARYSPIGTPRETASILKAFYHEAGQLAPPPRPASWADVAVHLKTLYQRLLSTSR